LPVSDAIKKVLLGEETEFSDVYALVLFYEKGDLESLQKTANKLNIDNEDIVKAYVDSLELANNLYS